MSDLDSLPQSVLDAIANRAKAAGQTPQEYLEEQGLHLVRRLERHQALQKRTIEQLHDDPEAMRIARDVPTLECFDIIDIIAQEGATLEQQIHARVCDHCTKVLRQLPFSKIV